MIVENYHGQQQVNLSDGIMFQMVSFQNWLDYFFMPSDWKLSNSVGYFKVWQKCFFELQLERGNL